jgi:hypothetical protein
MNLLKVLRFAEKSGLAWSAAREAGLALTQSTAQALARDDGHFFRYNSVKC